MSGGGGGFMMLSGGQGKMDALWNIDLGAKKSFFKKALTVSIRLSDILNSRQSHIVSYGDDFYIDSKNKRDSRQLWLSVSYNISNYKQAQKKQQQRQKNTEDDYDDGMMF